MIINQKPTEFLENLYSQLKFLPEMPKYLVIPDEEYASAGGSPKRLDSPYVLNLYGIEVRSEYQEEVRKEAERQLARRKADEQQEIRPEENGQEFPEENRRNSRDLPPRGRSGSESHHGRNPSPDFPWLPQSSRGASRRGGLREPATHHEKVTQVRQTLASLLENCPHETAMVQEEVIEDTYRNKRQIYYYYYCPTCEESLTNRFTNKEELLKKGYESYYERYLK